MSDNESKGSSSSAIENQYVIETLSCITCGQCVPTFALNGMSTFLSPILATTVYHAGMKCFGVGPVSFHIKYVNTISSNFVSRLQ
ncbi:uncharacterized protein BYT42DRAFT_587605 [Radiomyces spectabilis]|uniref:uncharacterized protein n=1 Tax=Radiomyces spectabilis TaxID=64574 RepID=UPI00222092D2|nr:uncharacterized protein BYT42DRAFT_587605 [Radiomyces spectabilis]KAI8366705.1 hypothetical protein BYT42DRAFT_587605 [Radiomyces spectabilis]